MDKDKDGKDSNYILSSLTGLIGSGFLAYHLEKFSACQVEKLTGLSVTSMGLEWRCVDLQKGFGV